MEPVGVSNTNGRIPMALAVLLCDEVLNSSGKNSLIGIFDKVTSAVFPAVHFRLYIYAKLADGAGTYELRVQYVDVDESKAIIDAVIPQPVEWKAEGEPLDITIQQQGLPIPHPGRYEFRLFLDNHFIGMAFFKAGPP